MAHGSISRNQQRRLSVDSDGLTHRSNLQADVDNRMLTRAQFQTLAYGLLESWGSDGDLVFTGRKEWERKLACRLRCSGCLRASLDFRGDNHRLGNGRALRVLDAAAKSTAILLGGKNARKQGNSDFGVDSHENLFFLSGRYIKPVRRAVYV